MSYSKHSKWEVSEDEYQLYKSRQLNNGNAVREQLMGGTKKLFVEDMLLAVVKQQSNLDIGELTQNQFIAFMAMFKRNLYSQFSKNQSLYNRKITFDGISRAKNLEAWDQLPVGMFMYNIDLSSAYWQITHKLGYISDNTFNKYLNLDQYKHVKRYCISFLARTNKMQYSFQNTNYEITCNNDVFTNVYENIRNELYNTIHRSMNGVKMWVEYNIDGVVVFSEDLPKVVQFFNDENLKYKITECQKISEDHYRYANTIRKFRLPKISL